MKRIIKTICNVLTIAIAAVFCMSLVACEDIKKLEVKFSVYNVNTGAAEERVMNIDLYRHLAPNTVDAVIKYAKDGYYNGTFLYGTDDGKLMLGDLKFDTANKTVVQNLDAATQKFKDEITGEFAMNNTVGSNLSNVEGSIGLWRDYTAKHGYKVSDNARDSGRATWYMPTSDMSNSFDGWFCVFAQFDLTDTTSATYKTWNDIKSLANTSSYYEEMYVYYVKTGDYVGDDTLNNGLEFHCVTKTEYESVDKDTVFSAEDQQYAGYNVKTIKVLMQNKDNKSLKSPAVIISSVTVK